MKNVFKSNTVDSIVSNLTKTVEKLTKVKEKHLHEAQFVDDLITGFPVIRQENLAEAARAEKIANNVKKLLDIS